jgi:rubrerythrin
MDKVKGEIVKMLNHALELEHQARIQYLAQAELIKGLNSESLVEKIKEIASDEQKHEEIFRNLIGNYLGAEPVMTIAPTTRATEIKDILTVNLKGEKDAIVFYKKIYKTVFDKKDQLIYEFETLEHQIRHVIIDEQEHVVELSQLLGL